MDEHGSVLLSDPGMLTVITEPTGELPKAWRYWPFSTEYREDTPLRITKRVDIHSFGMTMIEVKFVHSEKYDQKLTIHCDGLYTPDAISQFARHNEYYHEVSERRIACTTKA